MYIICRRFVLLFVKHIEENLTSYIYQFCQTQDIVFTTKADTIKTYSEVPN